MELSELPKIELPEIPVLAAIEVPAPEDLLEGEALPTVVVEEEPEKEPEPKSNQLVNCAICPWHDHRILIPSQESVETLSSEPLQICALVFPTEEQEDLIKEQKIIECPYGYDLSLRKGLDGIKKVIDLVPIQIEGTAPVNGYRPPNFPKPPLVDLLIVNIDNLQNLRVKLERGQYTTITPNGGTLTMGSPNGFGIWYDWDFVQFMGVAGAADYELFALKPRERTIADLQAEARRGEEEGLIPLSDTEELEGDE